MVKFLTREQLKRTSLYFINNCTLCVLFYTDVKPGCSHWGEILCASTFLNHDPDEANSFLLQPQQSKINTGEKKNMNWYNECDILIMSWNEDKQICICKLLHEPHFRSVNPIMAPISRPSLHGHVKLNFSMFYKTFLKLTTFWQPYNFSQMKIILYGRSNNISLRGSKTWWSIFCTIFLIKWLSSWYCHKVTTTDYKYKKYCMWCPCKTSVR